MRVSGGFSVEAERQQVFDTAEDFLVNTLKYRLETAERPSLLVVRRGSTLGSLVSLKLENYDTTLTLVLTQEGPNVSVVCDYEVRGYLAIFSKTHRYLLLTEIEKVKKYVNDVIHPPPPPPPPPMMPLFPDEEESQEK
ncbi:MAG: hypothetical protein OEY99_01690 [Aigarchaeota archaeon]|nr:hypothetical protein [Aigarchaeota archaeon]